MTAGPLTPTTDVAGRSREDATSPSSTGYAGTRRFGEIDAVRGLAAVSVVLSHSLLVFSIFDGGTRPLGVTFVNVLKYSPLHAAFAAAQAVLLFFVISGFVLALPFFGRSAPGYGSFLTRRVMRIWPMYAVACCASFIAAAVIGGAHVRGLVPTYDAVWRQPLTGGLLAQHLALVDTFPDARFDPVIWSLVHEMRLSIVFPLFVLAVTRVRAAWVVIGAVLWTYFAMQLTPLTADKSDLVRTLQYAGCFAAGALIARYRHELVRFAQSLRASERMIAAGALLALYTYPFWMPDLANAHGAFIDFTTVVLASAGFILLALSSRRTGNLLRTGPMQFLGRISYSLYLLHFVVLLALLRLFYGDAPTVLILIAMWILSFALAALGERYVERPARIAGRRMAARVAGATANRSARSG